MAPNGEGGLGIGALCDGGEEGMASKRSISSNVPYHIVSE